MLPIEDLPMLLIKEDLSTLLTRNDHPSLLLKEDMALLTKENCQILLINNFPKLILLIKGEFSHIANKEKLSMLLIQEAFMLLGTLAAVDSYLFYATNTEGPSVANYDGLDTADR
ncbi:hypothetical protein OTU49_015925 [Cherax quadricarinatus]|uniref:Uncharacterized protein n=1 Tax=Cherax quadricarinatus TaxID=27406 RepID=A0AAW0YB62_CHEQU